MMGYKATTLFFNRFHLCQLYKSTLFKEGLLALGVEKADSITFSTEKYTQILNKQTFDVDASIHLNYSIYVHSTCPFNSSFSFSNFNFVRKLNSFVIFYMIKKLDGIEVW